MGQTTTILSDVMCVSQFQESSLYEPLSVTLSSQGRWYERASVILAIFAVVFAALFLLTTNSSYVRAAT